MLFKMIFTNPNFKQILVDLLKRYVILYLHSLLYCSLIVAFAANLLLFLPMKKLFLDTLQHISYCIPISTLIYSPQKPFN